MIDLMGSLTIAEVKQILKRIKEVSNDSTRKSTGINKHKNKRKLY